MKQKGKREQKLNEYSLLQDVFAGAIVLVTYEDNLLIEEKVKVLKYDLRVDGKEVIPKLNVLFAFPFDDFETIHTGVLLNQKIASEKLQPIPKKSDRPVVASHAKYKKSIGRDMQITMRSGHVLSGKQIGDTQYTLILNINGKMVLVYKHGILEYEAQRETEDVP